MTECPIRWCSSKSGGRSVIIQDMKPLENTYQMVLPHARRIRSKDGLIRTLHRSPSSLGVRTRPDDTALRRVGSMSPAKADPPISRD
jgi:hypothetical protein